MEEGDGDSVKMEDNPIYDIAKVEEEEDAVNNKDDEPRNEVGDDERRPCFQVHLYLRRAFVAHTYCLLYTYYTSMVLASHT